MVENPNLLIEERQDKVPEFQEMQNPQGDLHLRFYVTSGYELALPALGIREVLSTAPDRITPVPNTSPLLLGLLNFRGKAVWVADLGQFLGSSDPLSIDRAEISVIAIEDHEAIVGLAVDRIVGMDWLELDDVQVSTHTSDSMAPFLKGEWLVDEASNLWLHLLDQTTIFRSARWAI